MNTCCFYEADFSDNYTITKKDENKRTLELFNLQGQYGGTILYKDDKMSMAITIVTETDRIENSGDGPYTHFSPPAP
jgi:hypothetical protein